MVKTALPIEKTVNTAAHRSFLAPKDFEDDDEYEDDWIISPNVA